MLLDCGGDGAHNILIFSADLGAFPDLTIGRMTALG
jgi:hypothetical protein